MPSFAEVMLAKGQPSLGSVHLSTALGNEKPKKGKKPPAGVTVMNRATSFRDAMAKRGVSPIGDIQALDQQSAAEFLKRNADAIKAGFAKGIANNRKLKPMDGYDNASHTPFPHDPNVLGRLRNDQVPRFFGALTDGQQLPTRTFKHKDLTAMQDRVDTAKVESMAQEKPKKLGVVVKVGDKHYIADGHHRISADYLAGKDESEAHFLDLNPEIKAVKRDNTKGMVPITVTKADPDQRMVFGFASVAERDGVLIIDKHEDIIPVATLEAAVYDYMLFSREGDDMHVGHPKSRCVESMVFTTEKCAALGIDLPKDDHGRPMQAWWTGFYVEDDALWKAYKDGARPEFSIAGSAIPIKV